MRLKTLVLFTSLSAVGIVPAYAHMAVVPSEVPAGSSFTAGFAVGHGCEGSPTTVVKMSIPAGVLSVKPVAKPGWEIEIVTGDYATPQTLNDGPVTSGVTQINWTGGSLPDAWYDEFSIHASLSDDIAEGSVIPFPIVQECENGGVYRWISVAGEGEEEADEPAPQLHIGEAKGGHGH